MPLLPQATLRWCSRKIAISASVSTAGCVSIWPSALRRLRLTAMREPLQLGASVKEACASAGLPVIGRTSLQYFERFGESLSATSSRASLPADSAR